MSDGGVSKLCFVVTLRPTAEKLSYGALVADRGVHPLRQWCILHIPPPFPQNLFIPPYFRKIYKPPYFRSISVVFLNLRFCFSAFWSWGIYASCLTRRLLDASGCIRTLPWAIKNLGYFKKVTRSLNFYVLWLFMFVKNALWLQSAEV